MMVQPGGIMAVAHVSIYTNNRLRVPAGLIRGIKHALAYTWMTTKCEGRMLRDLKTPTRKFIVSIAVKEVKSDL